MGKYIVKRVLQFIPVMFYTHTIAGSDRIKHLYVDPQKHADLGTAELA